MRRRRSKPISGHDLRRCAGTDRRRREGFTIIELLLALSLVVLLVGLTVISFGNWQDAARVGAGAEHVESVLRLARAQAASQGRRFRLTFHPETLQAEVQWESSPLTEPGQFVTYPGEWSRDLLAPPLRIRRCERRGRGAMVMSIDGQTDKLETPDGGVVQPIRFYPDGSCDSAVVEVVDGDEEEPTRVGRIDIDGPTGAMELRVMTPTEYEEQAELDIEAQGP